MRIIQKILKLWVVITGLTLLTGGCLSAYRPFPVVHQDKSYPVYDNTANRQLMERSYATTETIPRTEIMRRKLEKNALLYALPESPVPPQNVMIPALKKTAVTHGTTLLTLYFNVNEFKIEKMDIKSQFTNHDWIKAHPEIVLQIEGHADERGTAEYNHVLGEKRAKSVFTELEAAGIAPRQMRIISYGENKPVNTGRGESSWKLNRRVEIRVP
ncbi:MAG: OmpA family protein [SAR324 cluster bacterium]|nr:OmpA family protein [SAR324 cluster bacterium]